MAKCKTCQNDYPDKRKALGYSTCVTCSTEVKWSGIQVVHHKTGNETQIVKDPEVAAEFLAKSARVGFGTMRGMTNAYKRPTTAVATAPRKKEEPRYEPRPVVLSRKPLVLDFENVGEEVMQSLENAGVDAALNLIEKAKEARRILNKQAEQLRQIVYFYNGN